VTFCRLRQAGGRQAPLSVNAAALDQRKWGVGPGGGVSHRGCCPAEIPPAGHIQSDTLPGPVRFQGVGRTIRDPESVARPQRAATRLESAREPWGALRGVAVVPGQPAVSHVGYSLKEPWGEPQIVSLGRFGQARFSWSN